MYQAFAQKSNARHPEPKLMRKPTILEDDGSEWWTDGEKRGGRTEPQYSLCTDHDSRFCGGSESYTGGVKSQSWLNKVTFNLVYMKDFC